MSCRIPLLGACGSRPLVKHGIYQVRQWGDFLKEHDPYGRFVTLDGVAKGQPHGGRFVANEFVCGLLAMMLGLPCPPGAVVHTKVDGDFSSWYVLLKFGKLNERPPPANLIHLALGGAGPAPPLVGLAVAGATA